MKKKNPFSFSQNPILKHYFLYTQSVNIFLSPLFRPVNTKIDIIWGKCQIHN